MKRKTEIKWGIIFTLMLLAWILLERIFGLHDRHIDKHMIFTNFVAVPAIAIYYFALIDKRNNDYNGIMNYKQSFISGLIITLVVTILTPLTQYLSSAVISPHYFTNAIQYAVNSGKLNIEEANNYFNLKNYIFEATLGSLIMGIVTSAIVSLFTKSRNKNVSAMPGSAQKAGVENKIT